MSVLDKAKEHWGSVRTGSVEVPEWGVTVHFKRPTLAEHDAMHKERQGNAATALAKLVQARALDAAGARMFDDELSTLTDLRDNVDPSTLTRIATAIMAAPSVADAAKN